MEAEYEVMRHPDDSYIMLLYDNIKKGQSHFNLKSEVQHESLIPKLRMYQKDTVAWMLSRECNVNRQNLHGLFFPFMTSGEFCIEEEIFESPVVPGGVLADESGLGKTIEVLALILSNPRSISVNDVSISQAGGQCSQINEDHAIEDAPRHGKKSHSPNSISEITNFMCICGRGESNFKQIVICVKCGLTQHPECILFNTDSLPSPYLCPYCTIKEQVSSRATLIISPSSICPQWYEEIQNEVQSGTLKVSIYNGLKKDKFISPSILADNDIVLVSYETFKTEVNPVGINHSQFSWKRHLKKYAALPSPLFAIDWWRICLDEAQMLENSSSKPTEMVLRLHTCNRWLVTGTPIQRSVSDFYGIFLFLKHKLYSQKERFTRFLLKPFTCGNIKPLVDGLIPIFWRTLKKDVHSEFQIDVTSPIIVNKTVSLSSLERYFYEQQLELCTNEFLQKTNNYISSLQLKSLDQKAFYQVMAPLNRLRQIFCHSQAVNGSFPSDVKRIRKKEEIYDSLVKETKRECEIHHRSYISTLNGIAELCLIRKDLYGAVKAYIAALESVSKHAVDIKTDAIQKIHILYNLVFAIKNNNNIRESATTSDDKLICTLIFPDTRKITLPTDFTCVQDLEVKQLSLHNEFLLKHRKLLTAAVLQSRSEYEQVEKLKSEVLQKSETFWFQHILDNSVPWQKDAQLNFNINDVFVKHHYNPFLRRRNICFSSYKGIDGLKVLCSTLMEQLFSTRKELMQAIEDVMPYPSDGDVMFAKKCHLSAINVQQEARCKYCEAEYIFNTYENLIFNVKGDIRKGLKRPRHESDSDDISSDDDARNCGISHKIVAAWSDGPLEDILKTIFSCAPTNKLLPEILQASKQSFDLFEAMKKELKVLRFIIIQALEQIKAIDDLSKVKSRYHYNGFPEDDSISVTYFSSPRIVARGQHLSFEKEEHLKKMKNALARLLFLRDAVKSYNKDDVSEFCPICSNSLDSNWAALHCGHRVCYSCLSNLMKNSIYFKSVSCPMCRLVTPNREILLLDVPSKEQNNLHSKDNFPSKIFAIVGALMDIRNKYPTAKTIVFSLFDPVLKILMNAFTKNNIAFLDLRKKKNWEKLQKFKEDKELNVLVCPLRCGAKNLNIVEVDNMFFTEPLLSNNLLQETIHRVYPTGQMNQTKVYQFVVESSFEEKIKEYEKCNTSDASSDGEKCLTFGELKDLFIS